MNKYEKTGLRSCEKKAQRTETELMVVFTAMTVLLVIAILV